MGATVIKSVKKSVAAKPRAGDDAAEQSAREVTASTRKAGAQTTRNEAVVVGKSPPTKSSAKRRAAPKTAAGPDHGKDDAAKAAKITRVSSDSGKAPQSRAPLGNTTPDAGLEDKIHRSVVSKAIEVATKSPKTSTPALIDGAVLTEAQLLKMSDKDYMGESQLAFFKARLQQLEKDLLKNAGETTEHLRETVLVPDPADRATIEEEHALELRTRDRERKLLKKVQQSIASIDGGEYGWCEETGEPIGIPRLLARPTATLSLEAQQRRELKQKLYGD